MTASGVESQGRRLSGTRTNYKESENNISDNEVTNLYAINEEYQMNDQLI